MNGWPSLSDDAGFEGLRSIRRLKWLSDLGDARPGPIAVGEIQNQIKNTRIPRRWTAETRPRGPRRKDYLVRDGKAKGGGGQGQECEYVETSGTSMAAPHVSGVIAAFLSVRREFIGQPEKVKDIFVSTATDLKRERYFQGSGLVDLMRAIQSA